jgi:hypothetical protein
METMKTSSASVVDVQDDLGLIPPERSLSDLVTLSPVQLSGTVDGVDVLLADRHRR